jgi:charged multivesicular body protein 4
MSFFRKIFGYGKKGKTALMTERAIQKLGETKEMLTKKQDLLEKKIDQELYIASEYGKTNKRAAIQALKRKKIYDRQMQQIDGILISIEQYHVALDFASTNTVVLKSMGEVSRALKKDNADVDVVQAHEVMDDIAEKLDNVAEISETISHPVAFSQDFDEAELEAELNELLAADTGLAKEKLDRQQFKVGSTSVGLLRPKPLDADDNLEELRSWALSRKMSSLNS